MSEKTYRVIQWATGKVGRVAIRHFVSNPTYQLVGVLVTNPKKVGKDAGDIAHIPATGVIATDDAEKIVALHADCVHYSPLVQDLDMVCRLLRSGKSVVFNARSFLPIGTLSRRHREDRSRLRGWGHFLPWRRHTSRIRG